LAIKFISTESIPLVGRIGYSAITVGTSDIAQYKTIDTLLELFNETQGAPAIDVKTKYVAKKEGAEIKRQQYSINMSILKLVEIFGVAETTLRIFIKSKENQDRKYIVKEKRGKYIYKTSQIDRIKSFFSK
jgi:hypothetical protein